MLLVLRDGPRVLVREYAMAQIISQAPSAISTDEDDAKVHTGMFEPSQQADDEHHIHNLDSDTQWTGDRQRAVRRSVDRRSYDRTNRHHGQLNHAPARRRPPPVSELPSEHSTNRQLQPFSRQPGGRFDSFNTLPSGTDGSDFVAKLVLYGESGQLHKLQHLHSVMGTC